MEIGVVACDVEQGDIMTRQMLINKEKLCKNNVIVHKFNVKDYFQNIFQCCFISLKYIKANNSIYLIQRHSVEWEPVLFLTLKIRANMN